MADEAHRSVAEDAHELAHSAHNHPGAGFYVLIAVILTIITAVEVAVFYIPALKNLLGLILIVLSAAKFIMVVMFYMHLKFDSRIFTMVFLAPLVLAILVIISLILLFKVIPEYNP